MFVAIKKFFFFFSWPFCWRWLMMDGRRDGACWTTCPQHAMSCREQQTNQTKEINYFQRKLLLMMIQQLCPKKCSSKRKTAIKSLQRPLLCLLLFFCFFHFENHHFSFVFYKRWSACSLTSIFFFFLLLLFSRWPPCVMAKNKKEDGEQKRAHRLTETVAVFHIVL